MHSKEGIWSRQPIANMPHIAHIIGCPCYTLLEAWGWTDLESGQEKCARNSTRSEKEQKVWGRVYSEVLYLEEYVTFDACLKRQASGANMFVWRVRGSVEVRALRMHRGTMFRIFSSNAATKAPRAGDLQPIGAHEAFLLVASLKRGREWCETRPLHQRCDSRCYMGGTHPLLRISSIPTIGTSRRGSACEC